MTAVPVTWPELIARNREPLRDGLETLRALPSELDGVTADAVNPFPVAEELLGASGMLAQAAMVYGFEMAAPYVASVMSLLPRAFREIDGPLVNDTRVLAVSVLSLVNVARCCGVKLPADVREFVEKVEQRWPVELAGFADQLSDRERWTVALIALASGDVRLAERVTGRAASGSTFVPGEVFDFNTRAFLQYLAAAVASKADSSNGHTSMGVSSAVSEAGIPVPTATLTDVLPALDHFIQRFPHKLAAGMLRWDDLLYAGRIVFSNVGDEPLEVVAPAMNALITEISLREPH